MVARSVAVVALVVVVVVVVVVGNSAGYDRTGMVPLIIGAVVFVAAIPFCGLNSPPSPVALRTPSLGGDRLGRTCATILDASGQTPRAVADQLGHAQVSTTQNYYFGRGIANLGTAAALDAWLDPEDENHGYVTDDH